MKIAHSLPVSEIAVLLEVSERTVRRIVKLFTDTGDVKPKEYHHGPMRPWRFRATHTALTDLGTSRYLFP